MYSQGDYPIALDIGVCLEALEEAFQKGKPSIFNSDQGVQFISKEVTDMLEKHEVRISRD